MTSRKMHNSTVIKNLPDFPLVSQSSYPRGKGQLRNPGDMVLVWKTIEYFTPRSLLEIGFFGGQSMGLYLEAADLERVVSVDRDFSLSGTFDKLFPNNLVEFLNLDSKNLNLTETFDFITIDGDHGYSGVKNDIEKVLPLMHKDTILYMDEYCLFSGVEKVIKEYLYGQHDFVPFLAGTQGMFFHHVSHDANYFLDNFITNKADNFLIFNNEVNWNGFTVLFCEAPLVYTDSNELFLKTLEFYDL